MKAKFIYIITFFSLNAFGQSDTIKIIKNYSKNGELDSLQTQQTFTDLLYNQYNSYLENGKYDIDFSVLYEDTDHYSIVSEPRLSLNHEFKVKDDTSNSKSNSILDATNLAKSKLTELQDKGYPFAEYVSIAELKEDSLLVIFALNKGALIKMDSIKLLQRGIVKTPFIYNYLNYKLGSRYNEAYISGIEKTLQNSDIIELVSKPSVLFTGDHAQLVLDIKKAKSSRFDGIIGIQPSTNGKTSISGLLNLQLKNSLKRAETIYLNWERLKDQNQVLNAGIEIPYIFKSKAGIELNTNIIRQDSSLNRLELSYGLNYHLTPFSKIDIAIVAIKNNATSPSQEENINSEINNYQASFSHQNFNYPLNPQKGIGVITSLYTGTRSSNSRKSDTYGFKGEIEKYFPIFKQSTFKVFTKGESITSDSLNSHDLYITGGLNSIRGVDQRAISASSWITTGAEYRFLFDQNSAIFIFGEIHFNESQSVAQYSKDQIRATGLGLNVGNKNGIFSFSYGISDFGGENFLIKNGKINFGYTSTF